MRSVLTLFAIVLSPFVASCQMTAPGPSNSTNQARHAPAPGSVFRFKHWYTFANAAPEGPDVTTDSVIQRGTSYHGKADVLLSVLKVDTVFAGRTISYEPNGDISWFAPSNIAGQSEWERYPLSAKDTVVFIKGTNGLGNLVVDTLSYLESKDTTIEGHLWHAIKIRHIVSLDGHIYNNEVLWFDAETGWYLRMDMPPRIPFEPGLSSNGEEVHVYDCRIIP